MNLPNKLTVLRVIMVPFFVFFMLTDVGGAANKWIALVLFIVASLTDMQKQGSLIPVSAKNADEDSKPLLDNIGQCPAGDSNP